MPLPTRHRWRRGRTWSCPTSGRNNHIVPTTTSMHRRKRECGLRGLPSQIPETLAELLSGSSLGERFPPSNPAPPPPQSLGHRCAISLAFGGQLREPQLSTSPQSMEQTTQKLRNPKILERTLESRTAVDEKAKPWRCYLKFGNLNVSTTSHTLKGACGAFPPCT